MQTSELETSLLKQLHAISFKPDATIYVALSGGLDSACLLHALYRLNLKNPFVQTVCALHVHHGLSNNADDWLNFCEQQVEAYGFAIKAEKVVLSGQGGIEDQARESRYEVFKKYLKDSDVLLMAHHSDDQVETFMMRLMRGSGLTGLSAMEPKRVLGNGLLLRPWLNFSRKDLEQYKSKHDVKHIEDESNLDDAFDRNWWRHDLLPKLNKRFSQSQASILKSIDVLRQENQLLQELLEPIYQSAVVKKPEKSLTPNATLSIDVLTGQSAGIRQQVLRMWLAEQNIYPRLNSKQLEKIWCEVALARIDANPKFVWQGHEVRRYQNQLFVLDTLPEFDHTTSQSQQFNGENVTLMAGELCCEKNTQGLKPDDYDLVFYQGSLKAKPLGQSTKTLKKWLMAHNIPPWVRPYWPLLLKDGQLACVPGLFICEGFAVSSVATSAAGPVDTGWQLDFVLALPKK